MKSFYLTALAIAALGATAAAPTMAAPFETTSPGAATRYEAKLEAKFKDGKHEAATFGPALDITIPLVPGLETSFTLGREWERKGGVSKSGLSDLEWAAKWEIVPKREGARGVYVTVEPALILPTASNGFSDKWAVEIPFVVGHDFGAFELSGGAAYGHKFGEDENEVSGSVLLYRKINDRFGAGLEFATDAPVRRLGNHEARLNIGFKWEVISDLEFKARVGRTIVSAPGEGHETSVAIYLEKAF